MDSGNSGSIQSSSGGDEEYDSSRAAFAHLSNPPLPPQSQPHTNSPLFDPLPNYFDPNPPPLPNFDPTWSKSPITYNSLPLPSGAFFSSSPVPSDPPKTDPAQPHRNPKKRSRASRRAPTTVLTTDTTNFRAMVQEFTGIPAPPFTSSSSSPFLRNNRLDLFGAPSSTRSYPLPDALQPPPYLLRPFAQKFQPPPPTSFLNPNGNDVVSGGNSACSNANSANYQMQSQILTFQSLMGNPSVVRSGGGDLLEIPSTGNGDDTAVWGGMNGGDQSHQLRTVNGSYVDYSQSGGGGGKGNYEKGSENAVGAGRGTGGMVESWICSSDH